MRDELTGYNGSLLALAAVAIDDGSTLLASAAYAQEIIIWQPRASD